MQTLEEKVRQYKAKTDPLLKELNIELGAIPQFPIYKILPIEVELALEVLKKHGVQYHLAFKERKEKNANT